MLFNQIAWVLAVWSISHVVLGQQTCRQYVLISARGTNQPQGPAQQFKGMINTTLSEVANGIEYDLEYPASIDLIPSAIQGGEALKKYINDGIIACPQQVYALLGYSQGASAIALALQNITDDSSAAYKAIRAILVLGNPGHVAGAAPNIDQFGGQSTKNYNGSFYFDGLGAIPDLYYRADKILDICYQGDIICAATYPNATFAYSPNSTTIPPHGLYGPDENVQKMSSDFLIKMLNSENTATTSPNPEGGSSAGDRITLPSFWDIFIVVGVTLLCSVTG